MPFKGDPSKLDSAFQSVITPTGQENQGNAFDSFLKNEDPKTATKSQFGRGFEAGWDQIAGGLQYLTGDIAEEVPAWKEWGEAVKEGGARQLANAPKGQGMFYDMGTFVPQGLGIVGALLSAPVTAGTSLEVITPILGYSNLAALTGSVAGSAGYDYDTYTEENNLPRNEYVKAGVMLGSALMEIVGEYGLIPLNKGMSRYSGRLFKNLYKEGVAGKYAAQELIRDADSAYNLAVNFQKASPEGFKKLMQYATQMGKNAVGEGSEEFITQVGQDLLQNLYLEGDDKFNFQELMNDSMHAFRGGAMMGVMVSPFSTWTNNKLAQQRRQNQGGAFFGTSKDNETFEVVNVKPNGNTTILLPTGQEKTIPNEDITEKVFITNDDIDIIKGKIDKGQQIVKEEGRKMEENGLRQELNNQVSMFLNKDTQTLMSATKKDGTRIFITKGNPTAKSRVNDIAVLDPKTGKKEVLASNELDLNDLEERDPEEFVNNEVQRHFYEKDVQEQELIRNTQNSIKAQPGRSVVLPDGKTGTIQSIAPDGKLVITSEGEKGMPVVNTLPIDAVQVIEESDIDQIKQQMQQENGTNIQPKEQQQTAPVQTLPIGGKEYAYSEQEDGSVILDIGKAKPEQALKDVQSNLQDGYQAELLTEQQQPDQNVPAFIKQEPKKVVKGIRITQVQQTEQTTQQPVSQAQTTFNGNPVSDKEAMAIIEASDTIDDLQGLNTESEQIKKQIAKKYPESLPKYTINGKEVDREFAQNFLKYVKSSEKLNSIKVSNDEEFSQMLKNKASELGVTYNDSKQENKSENKKDKVVPKNKQLSLRKGRRAGQGSITKYSDLVDEDPVSIRHAILQYFLSGGRVNTDSIKDAVKFNMEERRQRIWMMANNAPTFDRLEEIILQELPQYEDARAGLNEFRDELNDVILSLPTMASMVDEINKMKQQIEQPPVPEEFKDFTPEDFQDQADNNPEDYSEAHKFLEDNWPVFEEFFNNGVLDWNALENKLNTDETFFTVFPFGLYDNEIVTLRKIISDEQSRNEIEQRLQQGESRSDNQTAVQGQETPTDRGNEGNGEPEQIQQQSEVTPELKKETSVNQEDNGTENTAIEAQSNNDQISPELQSRIDEKKKQIEDLKKKHEQMRDKLLSRNGLWGDTQDDGSPKMFDDNFEPTSENIDKALAPIKGEIAAAKRELQNLESGVKEAAGQEEINLDDQISNTAKNNELKKAEKEINLNPSEEQKKAGNYKMGKVKLNGFDITIENPAGSIRSGIDSDGEKWEIKMNNSYGYFRGSKGIDGDQIDVFLGENLNSDKIFVVDQNKKSGIFDEVKVMLGFDNIADAANAYLSNYSDGWTGMGAISETSIDSFKDWLKNGETKKKFETGKAWTKIYPGISNMVANEGEMPEPKQQEVQILRSEGDKGLRGVEQKFSEVHRGHGEKTKPKNDIGQKGYKQGLQQGKLQVGDLESSIEEQKNSINDKLQGKNNESQRMGGIVGDELQNFIDKNKDLQLERRESFRDSDRISENNINNVNLQRRNNDNVGNGKEISNKSPNIENQIKNGVVSGKSNRDASSKTNETINSTQDQTLDNLIEQTAKQNETKKNTLTFKYYDGVIREGNIVKQSKDQIEVLSEGKTYRIKPDMIVRDDSGIRFSKERQIPTVEEVYNDQVKVKGEWYSTSVLKGDKFQVGDFVPDLMDYAYQKFSDSEAYINPAFISDQKWNQVNKYLTKKGFAERPTQDWIDYFTKRDGRVSVEEHIKAFDKVFEEKEKPQRTNQQKFITKAKRYFGVTRDFKEAGYLLKDGSMLDFSGRRQGNTYPNGRALDHREIGYADENSDVDMVSFMADGNIRMKAESDGFEVTQELTKEQARTLISYIRSMKNGALVDFSKPGEYGTDFSIEYGKSVPPQRIINDINNYYRNGVKPVLSNNIRFSKTSPTGFYSTVEKALNRISQKKGTPEQFKAMLLKNGAKQAELDWMGYDDAFTGQKSVTKEDIQNFIDQNKIDVQEVVKGASKWEGDELIDNGEVVANLVENEDGTWSFQSDLSEGEEKYDTREIAMREAEFATVSDVYSQSGTKYEQYVLPGGENYRELLLTMPFKNNKKTFEEWKEHREFLGIPNEENTKEKYEEEVGWYDKRGVYAKEEVFKSSHFDEPNILAHIRFDERTDANGERVLMVQEIQSDWAQKGKKEGFNTPELKSKRNDLHKEWSEVEKEMIPLQRKSRLEVVGGTDPLTPEERNRLNYLEKRDKELATQNQELGFNPVPDMPFKQTPQWVNLALRRAIRYASENGFDRIAWTTGEQQAERYDLSKQVDYITKHSENRVNKEKNQIDVTISVNNGLIGLEVDKETGKVVDQNGSTKLDQVVGKGLDEVIGKDVAEKILSLDETEHTLKDKDLKVGGEGMKSFYNQIVPNLAGKLGKKFGAQVDEINIPNGVQWKIRLKNNGYYEVSDPEGSLVQNNIDPANIDQWKQKGYTVQSIPITQSMRESAMEGMPLFEKKPEYTGDLNDFAEKTAKWVEGARKQIKEFSDKFGVDAVGVSNVSQLPADVRQKLGGSMQGVGGFIDVNTGKIYVNLTKVSSYDKVQRILIHEAIGHKGVRGLLGTELDDVLWSVYRGMPEGAFNELVQAYETEDPYLIAEEYIAKISEDGSNPTLLNRVISKIREILRKIFPKLSYSNSEIRTLLEKSKDYLLSQKYSNKKDEGVRFNKYSELTRVNETVASTGSVYETYRKGGVYLKVRYSDHDSNILMADSDLELNIELRGTNEAKSLIESAIDAKSKNIINLDRDNENINVLGYDSVEKRGGYVILKYTQTEEYTDEQLKERFSDNKNNIDQYKNSKYTRKEGDKWIKETPKTITLLDREFYRRFPNVRFYKESSPTQIKSATGNNGEFNPNNPDIRFSKVKQATKDAEILNGWKDKVRRNIQDKMLGVRRLQEWLTAQGVEITDDQDAYNAENKSASKAFAAQKKYEKEQYKDLVNAVQQIKNSTDKTTEEISTYLMAKHAPERNEYFIEQAVNNNEDLQSLNARIKVLRNNLDAAAQSSNMTDALEIGKELENAQKEYSNLQKEVRAQVESEFETASGFTTDKANKIKEKFESEVDKYYVDNLIKAVKDNTDFVLDRWQQDGFISNETKQMLKDRWKNYVPLRGWQYDEGDPEFEYFMDTYTGKLNSPNKTAKGRKSIADDPLSNLVNMVHSAIIMGEKNKVKQKMANLISANIETLGDKAGYNQYFRVQLNDNPDNPEFMYLSPAEVKAMDSETIKSLNPEQVIAIEHGNKRSIGQMKEHEANVFIDGKMYTMHFQDPEIARAMNNAHFPRMQAATLFLQNSIGKVTRTMSSLLTSHNPAFFIPNLFRDVAFAGEGFFIEQGPKATIMFGKNVARVQKAIIKGYLGREEKTDLDKLYNQFIQYGGQTGYAHLHDVQQFKNKIKSDIKKIDNAGKLRNAPVKVFNNMLDLIESVAGWSEDVSRFATFVTLIEMGESPEVATNHAKNITVNFNRKGVYSGMFGSIYAFFNARVQGGARLAHLGKVHPARAATIAVGHIAIGFLMSQLFDMLSGDDDEGVREYDKVSDYMKSNYLNLPDFIRGEGYISIPVPHGTRMFHSLGSLLYDYSTGRKNMMQVASGGFGNAIGEFSPVDFHRFINQKGELSLMPLAPTALVPAFETFWTNTDFMGRPIAKEMYTKQLDEQTPDSQKYYKSVNPILKSFTRFLFTVGGGDPESGLVYKPGTTEKVPDALDINPEHLEHLIQGYTGGLGKFTNDLFKSLVVPAVTYAQEEQHKGDVFDSYVNTWKDHGEVIPIFNRFFRDFYGDPVRDAFYNIYEQANIIDTWKKHYKDTGDIEGLMNLMKDPERFYNSKRAILYHDAINNLRGIGNLENLPEADKERIDNEVRKLMIEAVGDYKEVTYKGKQ